jgi:signal transduction histidine kinase/ActR/RegA family two-component response regulator
MKQVEPGPSPLRVLLRAATARDAEMASAVLARAGIVTDNCPNLREVIAQMRQGAGALLIAEEALAEPNAGELVQALSAQPAWSDLPLLVLARQGANSRGVIDVMDLPANVTVLERPMRVASLVSVVRSALRARQRQYQLRTLLDGLRETDQRKTEFLATLAHELRNPMAPLSTALSILQRMKPDPTEAQRYYELMDRQVKHMVHLVDDLMEISRVTRAQINLQQAPVVIRDAITEAIELSRPLMDAPGHRLIVACDDPTLVVNGDRVRLVQVFSNLLNNAAKYTFEDGRVEIVARRMGSQVQVMVRDNGVGIPESMLESVFGMFVQVNGTARAAQGGLGIGLTLVRNLVKLHGGTVSASSAGHGQGTTVTVMLPLMEPNPAAEPADEAFPTPARIQQDIMIVDDNRDAADSLAAVLRLMGATTRVAYDGETALATAAAITPTIAILDIGMPRMDGYELARRLRADPRHKHLALVALTGWGQASDRERIANAGFDHHLLKPVDIAELTSTLVRLSQPTAPPKARARG